VEPIPDWLLGVELSGEFKIQDNMATIYKSASPYCYVRVGTTRVNSIFVHGNYLSKVSQDVPS
jgi:hypothetical protein